MAATFEESCLCGTWLKVTSDTETALAIVAAFWELHKGHDDGGER